MSERNQNLWQENTGITETMTVFNNRVQPSAATETEYIHPDVAPLMSQFEQQDFCDEVTATNIHLKPVDSSFGRVSEAKTEEEYSYLHYNQIEIDNLAEEQLGYVQNQDYRTEPRYPCLEGIILTNHRGQLLSKGWIKNLSLGGAALSCSASLKIGDEVIIEFVGSKNLPAFQLSGQVVRQPGEVAQHYGLVLQNPTELARKAMTNFFSKN